MSMTDPIADMLTRMRNAIRNHEEAVDMPFSTEKRAIADVLKREGYIRDCREAHESIQGSLRLYFKYAPDGESVITHLKRVSKPGCRVYRGVSDLAPVLNGLGIVIVSTPKGVLSDREARTEKVGGEVICEVY